MEDDDGFEAREIWVATPTTTYKEPHCTAFDLPARGLLVMNATVTITLAQDAVYQPFCTSIQTLEPNATLPIEDFRVPFVASTVPQIFVIGAMLVIAWTLVIILIITPRTLFVVGRGGGIIGRRAVMGGAAGTSSVIGIGGRPWLQKVAATTVGISLIIATVNSMRVASEQYDEGYEDAIALTDYVVGSLEIRIVRIVSDTFLWLAQVQTLIRLFPRRKEKVIIKWTGFALITLDTLFSALDNFVSSSNAAFVHSERDFTDAVPALAYFFQLTLSLVYAALVMYYSYAKRRFAYYHEKMRNISLVALLSILSISVPIIFFVLDIAEPDLIGWGDYVRWVGGAAASVVVWEWVERMEALEREERKDGILGREIFDRDDMVELTNPVESRWPRRRRDESTSRRGSRGNGGEAGGGKGGGNIVIASSSHRPQNFIGHLPIGHRTQAQDNQTRNSARSHSNRQVNISGRSAMPIPAYENVATPTVTSPAPRSISRSNTNSAASTVYAVIHHPVPESTSRQSPASNSPLPQGMQDMHFQPEATSHRSPSQDATGNLPPHPGQEVDQQVNAESQPRAMSAGRSPGSSSLPIQLDTSSSPPMPQIVLKEEGKNTSKSTPNASSYSSLQSRLPRFFRRNEPTAPSEVSLSTISPATGSRNSDSPSTKSSIAAKGRSSLFRFRQQPQILASDLPTIIMTPQPAGQGYVPSISNQLEHVDEDPAGADVAPEGDAAPVPPPPPSTSTSLSISSSQTQPMNPITTTTCATSDSPPSLSASTMPNTSIIATDSSPPAILAITSTSTPASPSPSNFIITSIPNSPSLPPAANTHQATTASGSPTMSPQRNMNPTSRTAMRTSRANLPVVVEGEHLDSDEEEQSRRE